MNSKPKVWIKRWILLAAAVFIVWYLLPQYTLKIRIDASPDGVQDFYVETKVILPQWHGVGNFKTLDSRLLSPNKTHHVSIYGNLRPWTSGKMIVVIMHPEYRKITLLEKGYRGRLLEIKPQFWPELLRDESFLELQVPKLVDRPPDYVDKLVAGKILPMASLSEHMAWVKTFYLPALDGRGDIQMIAGSIPVLRQLADYSETRSDGRTDGNKYSLENFMALKSDLLMIERQLK